MKSSTIDSSTSKTLLKNAYNLLFLLLIFSFNTAYAQLIQIDYPDLPPNNESGIKIDIGDLANNSFAAGMTITAAPLTSNQRGQREGIRASSSSKNITQQGSTSAQIAAIKAQGGDGAFIGVFGDGTATALTNQNSVHSIATGGYFRSGGTSTSLTLASGRFYVGGVLGELQGAINSSTNTNRAIAAVIGLDKSSGTAQSWAAYLEGKNYLSDQTIIGRKTIPTTADGMNVANYKLFVTGGILAEEVVIALENLWADYVFSEDYDLKSLEEVDRFIDKNGYLPDFPSAMEIEKAGLKLGDITVLQQEKIEELFLHAIELDQQNKQLQLENEALKAKMAAFEKRLSALEK